METGRRLSVDPTAGADSLVENGKALESLLTDALAKADVVVTDGVTLTAGDREETAIKLDLLKP